MRFHDGGTTFTGVRKCYIVRNNLTSSQRYSANLFYRRFSSERHCRIFRKIIPIQCCFCAQRHDTNVDELQIGNSVTTFQKYILCLDCHKIYNTPHDFIEHLAMGVARKCMEHTQKSIADKIHLLKVQTEGTLKCIDQVNAAMRSTETGGTLPQPRDMGDPNFHNPLGSALQLVSWFTSNFLFILFCNICIFHYFLV